MSTRIDYGQLAAKLDYTALGKKLEQLGQEQSPKKRKKVADVLEPLRERLLALHGKGWSSGQLAEELKTAGIPVSSARIRECLNRWNNNGNGVRRTRANRRPRETGINAKSPAATLPDSRAKSTTGDGQAGLKLTGR
jgi:hypothetical protein